MNQPVSDKKKHTGRNLVLLNASLGRESFFKAAAKSSVELVHFKDYRFHPEHYIRAFTEADGIFFEELKVAVINFEKEDQIDYLNEMLAKKAILVTEPERYVYKVDHRDYMKGYRDGVNSFLENLGKYTDKKIKQARRFTDSEKASWGIKTILAEESSLSGKGVKIAVLDTGIFKEHIDLKGRKIKTKKFVESSTAGDADGHGTHCAGIACGFRDAGGFRYGVAYESEIFCGKVLNDEGEGTDGGILAGIEWALSEKCHVISMSLGAAAGIDEPYSETYETVAKRAMQQGALIIAAAGNESSRPVHIAPEGHPANCPSIMAVGAVDSALKIAYFSCGGINKNGGQVDIVAPGVSVYSMVNTPGGHEKWDGTSMAAPFVAGVASLYFEQNSGSSPLNVWTLLTQHAKRLDISSVDVGSGLVQAPRLINLI